MSNKSKAERAGQLVVGLDVGSSTVVTVVAEVKSDGDMEIIGYGQCQSAGVRRGMISNIERTVEDIQNSIGDAEIMASCQISSVFAGIAGSHIKSCNSLGPCAVSDGEVDEDDIKRAIEVAQAVPIDSDQTVLHTLAQEFIVDQQEGISDPIGMSAIRLEVELHIVTTSANAEKDLVKCIRRSGLEVDKIILEPLASAEAVLSDDDKDKGVCLVDIGGGTIDVIVYHKGAVQYTKVHAGAGDLITADLAHALKVSTSIAEKVKQSHGCALAEIAEQMKGSVEVTSASEQAPSEHTRQVLAQFIEPRVRELFEMVRVDLERNGCRRFIHSGVVLTGGSANMPGMVELAAEVLGVPTRIGVAENLCGFSEILNNPAYSTSLGLVQRGLYENNQPREKLSMKALWQRFTAWWADAF